MQSDPRRIAGITDLTFVNVTTKDAQVIQCNVTNKHGYNFTNAYVNVYSMLLSTTKNRKSKTVEKFADMSW